LEGVASNIHQPLLSKPLEKGAIDGPLGTVQSTVRNTPTRITINPPSRTQARTSNRFTAQSTTDATDGQSGEPGKGSIGLSLPWLLGSQRANRNREICRRSGWVWLNHVLGSRRLTRPGSVKQLSGDLVRFEDKECGACHDQDIANRPPPGFGLDAKAKVELDGCWSIDNAIREAIEDENYSQMLKHLKRLRGGYGVRVV
jgi:hypothetical protein